MRARTSPGSRPVSVAISSGLVRASRASRERISSGGVLGIVLSVWHGAVVLSREWERREDRPRP